MDQEKPIDPEVADALYDVADFLDLAYVVMAIDKITYSEAWAKVKPYEEDLSKYPLDSEGLYMLACLQDLRKENI